MPIAQGGALQGQHAVRGLPAVPDEMITITGVDKLYILE